MKSEARQIAQQVTELLERLVNLADSGNNVARPSNSNLPAKKESGAAGGIRVLINEGYFDHPRTLSDTSSKLKQDGRHYPKSTIAMGLLNHCRSRTLTRLQESGSKQWKYVIRK